MTIKLFLSATSVTRGISGLFELAEDDPQSNTPAWDFFLLPSQTFFPYKEILAWAPFPLFSSLAPHVVVMDSQSDA